MKKFTLKDFIHYNSPCFSCNEKPLFVILNPNSDIELGTTIIHPVVFPTYTSITLELTYRRRLILHIHHKDNRIETNDMEMLEQYFQNNDLMLQTVCDKCHTKIISSPIKCNFEKKYVYPVSIQEEKLRISDDLKYYAIDSLYELDKTTITVTNKIIGSNYNLNTLVFVGALQTLHKLKTKENIMKKIKNYLLFS